MSANFAAELAATTKKSVAPKNRVELLLEELERTDPENLTALMGALHDTSISGAAITRTIKRVWGEDAVNNTSVRAYRAQNGII